MGRNTIHDYFKRIINHGNHLISQIMVQTSYDIIKAHGGELKVETKEDERTTFAITLPLNSSQ